MQQHVELVFFKFSKATRDKILFYQGEAADILKDRKKSLLLISAKGDGKFVWIPSGKKCNGESIREHVVGEGEEEEG